MQGLLPGIVLVRWGLILLGAHLSFSDLTRLLRGFLVLMMLPGADRGIDEAAKEEEEADK